jgi:hypothetical protein
LLSILLWWRASLLERKDEQAAREERKQFIPDWSYIRQRLEESNTTMADNGNPTSAVE